MNEIIAIILIMLLFISTLYIYLMVQIFRIDDKVSDLNRRTVEILRELREKGGE